ncbi:hypothetical protein ACU4US_001440 [Campylobacter jejuni]
MLKKSLYAVGILSICSCFVFAEAILNKNQLIKELLVNSPSYAQKNQQEALKENITPLPNNMPLYRQPLFAQMVVFPYVSNSGVYHDYTEHWFKIKQGDFQLQNPKQTIVKKKKVDTIINCKANPNHKYCVNNNIGQISNYKATVKAYRIISREKPNVKSKQVKIYKENRILDIEDIVTNETGTKWAKLANKEEYISAKWLEINHNETIKDYTDTNSGFKDKKIIKKPFEVIYLKNPKNANYYNENLKIQKKIDNKQDDDNLSKEDQEFSNKVMKIIQTVSVVYDSEDSKSQKEIVKNMASSYLNASTNELAKEFIDSLNTFINTYFSFNYNGIYTFTKNI